MGQTYPNVEVVVTDNGSTDGSLEVVADDWPAIGLVVEPNRGLASFNAVLPRLDEPVVLLLNNDVKLDPGAVGPLLRVFDLEGDALFAAPSCWTFDGSEYEGMRTRVRTRYGLVQGLCRVPGHEALVDLPDLTAYLDDLLRTRERLAAAIAGVDEWARADATPAEEEITRIRRLISRINGDITQLTGAERAQVDEAVTVIRKHRAVSLGMPSVRITTPSPASEALA